MDVTLYSWAIENILKNSVDAMKNQGTIDIRITDKKDKVEINIKDEGKGMPPSKFRKMFEVGYSGKTNEIVTRIIFQLDPEI